MSIVEINKTGDRREWQVARANINTDNHRIQYSRGSLYYLIRIHKYVYKHNNEYNAKEPTNVFNFSCITLKGIALRIN